MSDDDRSLRAFFRAIRGQPGFWAQVAGTAAFGTASAIRSGIIVALLLLAVGIGLMVGLGYPRYRRRGRIG